MRQHIEWTYPTLRMEWLWVHMRELWAQTSKPSDYARQRLEAVVERFDEACARRAREDGGGDGRWRRAFEGVDLGRDVGLTRAEALKMAVVFAYGVMLDDQIMDPVRLWERDWLRLLSEQEGVLEQEVYLMMKRHVMALYALPWSADEAS